MPEDQPISIDQVAQVIADVNRLDFTAKVKRLDRIFVDQPAVLGAVVQLHALGVDPPTQEHAFHVLLVLYECFTRHVPDLPRISEEMVQAALDNNAAMLKFYDDVPAAEAARLQQRAALKHPERNVLAFVVSYLHEQLPKYSRENELVITVCKTVMDAFVKAKQLANRPTAATANRRASQARRKLRAEQRGRQ